MEQAPPLEPWRLSTTTQREVILWRSAADTTTTVLRVEEVGPVEDQRGVHHARQETRGEYIICGGGGTSMGLHWHTTFASGTMGGYPLPNCGTYLR
jgi:hypothetical protein